MAPSAASARPRTVSIQARARSIHSPRCEDGDPCTGRQARGEWSKVARRDSLLARTRARPAARVARSLSGGARGQLVASARGVSARAGAARRPCRCRRRGPRDRPAARGTPRRPPSRFRVDVVPGEHVGAPVELRLAPALPYFKSAADAVTLRGGGQLVLDIEVLPDGSGESVRVSGAVSEGRPTSTYWRAVALPERYAAALLRAQLEAQGVRVAPRVRFAAAPADARELLRFSGEPLALQVRLLEKFSNNFVAEQLTKMLGADLYGPPGTWEKGTRALGAYLEGAGIVDPALAIADGSGLSPRNRISPATLAAVLRRGAQRFDSGPEFLSALPIGGREGTLEDRMHAGAVQIRAKTGHLRRVAALSGVVPGANGSTRVFSVMVNGARGDADGVDAAIAKFAARVA